MKDITYAAMFLAVIAIIYAIIYTGKKSGRRTSAKGEYDERQDRIRGRGYRISFFAYMIEFAALMFIDGADLRLPLTDGAMYAIMFLIPICIFVVYCISKDAFVGVGNRINHFIALAAAVLVVSAASTIAQAARGEMIVDGKLTGACITPAYGLLFLVVLISLSVKNIQKKAEEGMADEES
jgi:hypothetical protein